MTSFKLRKISFALLFALLFSTVSACSDVSTQSKSTNDVKAATTTNVKTDKTQSSSDSSKTKPASSTTSSSTQKSTSPTNTKNDSATTNTETQNKTLANLEFKGQQVIELNNNHVTFSRNDLSLAKGSWQTFSNLDSMNRVGVANAMLSKSLMPTKEREPLHVDPTGWKNKKVVVNGKTEWLYNRCHLIGFQLTGENNNMKNLMTGTRSLNDPDMLVYENKVASYLKTTNRHIRYQVEPVFRGNELVARGVHMQGKSIEDSSLEFNVYIFNVEQGVTINYADGSSTVQSAATTNKNTSSTTNTNKNTAATTTNKSTNSTSPITTSISASTLIVNPGDKATVTVKTKPNVQGTIEVDYASGPSHAEGLEPKSSDSNGNVSWTWEVGTRTKPGTYDVIINVNGQTITKQLVVK